jgi:hypothetical protein
VTAQRLLDPVLIETWTPQNVVNIAWAYATVEHR